MLILQRYKAPKHTATGFKGWSERENLEQFAPLDGSVL